MDLSGHHSNPPAPLEALLGGAQLHPKTGLETSVDPRTHAPGTPVTAVGAAHPRQGRIIDAISKVLAEERHPIQARDVHAQVEALLGEPVRWASVKATLAGNLTGPAPRFIRVARGRYSVPLRTYEREQSCSD
jgi:hypothetical protein